MGDPGVWVSKGIRGVGYAGSVRDVGVSGCGGMIILTISVQIQDKRIPVRMMHVELMRRTNLIVVIRIFHSYSTISIHYTNKERNLSWINCLLSPIS